MTNQHRGMAWMLLFVALWAVVEALALALYRDYSLYQVVWMRYAVHLVFMVLAFGLRDPKSLIRTKRPGYQLTRSMMMLVMPASFIEAVRLGFHPDAVMSLFWLCPLFALVLGRWILGERTNPLVWVATLVGYAGALAIFGLHAVDTGSVVVPLAMGVSLALYLVMTGSLKEESTRACLFYSALGVFVVLTPAMPLVWITPPPHDIAIMAAIGLLGFGCLFCIDRLSHAAPITASSSLTLMNLPIVLAMSWALGAHRLGVPGMVGIGLILGASLFIWLRAPSAGLKGGANSSLQSTARMSL